VAASEPLALRVMEVDWLELSITRPKEALVAVVCKDVDGVVPPTQSLSCCRKRLSR